MPSGAIRPICPVCWADDIVTASVVHHMICAYVGPDYDFEGDAGYRCPKCLRALHDHDRCAEIVGESARCQRCGAEFIVPDGTVQGA